MKRKVNKLNKKWAKQFIKLSAIDIEKFNYFQGEVPSDWLVIDSDKEVLSLQCPSKFQGVKEEDIVVWVDPLDGTSEYTQGQILKLFYYTYLGIFKVVLYWSL